MWSLFLAAFAGVAAWTLAEYVLHRFLGHDRRTMPNFFSVEHTRHHSQGDYFAPTPKKVAVGALAALFVFPAGALLAGLALSAAFTAGFVAMYVTYEVVHRRSHTHVGIGRYARWLRRHHFHHHFENPHVNHGVTTPVWDVVFGTLVRTSQIRVPPKMAMQWLCDPATGDVWPAFRPHYALRPTHVAP